MSSTMIPQSKWLLLLGAILLGNLALYLHLSTRLDRMEKVSATNAAKAGNSNDAPSTPTGFPLTGLRTTTPISDGASSPEEAINRMMEHKAQTANVSTATLAAELDTEVALEPNLPAVEQRQYQWLNDALHRLSADSPKARDLQTTCRGRRCMVTAYFDNDSDARGWARRYVLAGGGEVLKRSRLVIQPVAGSDKIVSLRLYLD